MIQDYYKQEWQEHLQVAQDSFTQLETDFTHWVAMCRTALGAGNKLIFCGNGGSAADAQHLATELTVRYKTNRNALAALALTTDTSALTAIGNDFGFDYIFSRQLEALGKKGDVLIAITTSGKSPNIIEAVKIAKELGIKTTTLTGGTGGAVAPLVDLALIIPSTTTARIQEMHITLGQMLCGVLEQEAPALQK